MAAATKKADVIVVGAGMGGLSTASSLRQAGISSIVLEARPDRIGGRMWSSHAWPEAPCDMGASWLSHMTINPLVEVARANKIKLVPSELTNVALVEGNGTHLSDDETTGVMALYFTLYGLIKAAAARRMRSGKPDIPLSEEIARQLKKLDLDDETRRAVDFFINFQIAEANNTNLDDLSLYHWEDDYTQDMLAISVVPEGYAKIAEALATGLDIRKGHVVSRVQQTADGVTVTTNRGDFTAPYAVVAVPHGVLAKRHVTFSPPLPAWKLDAINAVKTGFSSKTYLLFPKKFWKSNHDILGRIDPTEQGRWSTWINFHRYTRLPILMCFNRAEHARALDRMTDEEVQAEAMEVLRGAYGTKTPNPIRIQHSRWSTDPFAEGVVPYTPPGSTGAAHRVLAKPVGRIRFAGDSTHEEFVGLVFGAFLSGVREAGELTCLLYGDVARLKSRRDDESPVRRIEASSRRGIGRVDSGERR